jgi:hypothetical protein
VIQFCLNESNGFRHAACVISDVVHAWLNLYTLNLVAHDDLEQSPWETDSFTASQEIPHRLWDPKFHYRVYNGPIPEPDKSSKRSHVVALRCILISFYFRLDLAKWPLSFSSPHHNPVCTCVFPYTCHVHHPSRSPWFWSLEFYPVKPTMTAVYHLLWHRKSVDFAHCGSRNKRLGINQLFSVTKTQCFLWGTYSWAAVSRTLCTYRGYTNSFQNDV